MSITLHLPPRTFSATYTDNREAYRREPVAFNVRHESTVEILRFRDEKEAERWQKGLRKRGYKKVRQRRLAR